MRQTPGNKTDGTLTRRDFLTVTGGVAASLPFVNASECLADRHARAVTAPAGEQRPFIVAQQGSFAVGGTVVTNPGTFDPILLTPDGHTIHGDHAYVQYQIPPDARNLPLVLWHGGGQFSKTWETTPDGREGYQTIFLRRGWAVYILDQPRRGRAGRGTVGTTVAPVPGPGATGEQGIFVRFRIGIWPDYFPAVQFTHSASGLPGWLTKPKSESIRAIVSYEPVGWAFPQGEVPPPISTSGGPVSGTPVPPADFATLATVPVQLVYGDNIPASPSPYPGLDLWRARQEMAGLFVETLKRHGGDAQLLRLPDIGVTGNTHFAMSDLNNVRVADLLSQYLRAKGLDRRGRGDD